MKTIILCGGFGTRMREETEYRPKPLVEIGGRPILWHIMKIYAASGYLDFVLCLGYRGQMIKDYFLRYHAMNHDFTLTLDDEKSIRYHDVLDPPFTVTLADTGIDTMTGGRVRRAARYVNDDTFLLTYGDGVADIDVGKLVDFHHSHGRMATVTVTRTQSRFGIVDIGSDGVVERFVEKPVINTWASAGFFVFNRQVLDYLNGDKCVLEQEPLERLAAEGQLVAYRHEGFFFAMDTYREVLHLNDLWNQQQAPWRNW